MTPAWLFGCGLAVAEWAAAFGLASLVWAMIEAGVGYWQGAAVCAVFLLLWSVAWQHTKRIERWRRDERER